MRERSKNAIKVMSWCWPDDPRSEQKVICKTKQGKVELRERNNKRPLLIDQNFKQLEDI